MDCVFIGDSIAQGVAQFRPECANHANVGQTTAQTLLTVHRVNKTADHVMISVGSNDTKVNSKEFRKQIQQLRKQLALTCVTWLLPPNNRRAKWIIRELAINYGDLVLDVMPGPDQVHPTRKGYQNLAKRTQKTVCEVVAQTPF